jgi:hypothetical protein
VVHDCPGVHGPVEPLLLELVELVELEEVLVVEELLVLVVVPVEAVAVTLLEDRVVLGRPEVEVVEPIAGLVELPVEDAPPVEVDAVEALAEELWLAPVALPEVALAPDPFGDPLQPSATHTISEAETTFERMAIPSRAFSSGRQRRRHSYPSR